MRIMPLVLACLLPASAAHAATIAVSIDLGADRRPIDPAILGVSNPPANLPRAYPFVRWGGNSTTRYNWQVDVHNTAADWFFMNIANHDGSPASSEVERLVAATLAAGGRPLVTIGTIGWTPIALREKRWGFSVAEYGAQQQTECSYFGANPPSWCMADAGNGRCSQGPNCSGGVIVGNRPTDTSFASGPNDARAWIAHLQQRFGTAAAGGIRDYALDNEPMLWNSTHRDVHPQPLTYDALWSYTVAYAGAIKQQEPNARVHGPVTWGYCDLFGSAADECVDGPDRAAHGGTPLVKWYLQQVCAFQQQHGVRLVDTLDLHYYPQGSGVVDFNDPPADSETAEISARRLRSLRELYDPQWTSESWIADLGDHATWHYSKPGLIRRVRGWIDEACPGTRLAITEYNWGADNGASSALAQAEVLAIFGREGVDAATRWVSPRSGSLVERAFRLHLDYDGAGSRVEGTSVRATSADVDALGAYAVHRAGSRVMLLLFNKATTATTAAIDLGSRFDGGWRAYRFSGSEDLHLASTGNVAGTTLTLVNLPPRSATLLVLPDVDRVFANGFEGP